MKKKRYIALILILSLFYVDNVYASCTEDKIKEFNKVKNEYKIITEYDNKTQTYNMMIETANNSNFGYVFTIDYSYSCEKVSNTLTKCTGLKPGTTFIGRVIGLTNQCNDLLKEEEIKLIRNNKYYGDPLCEGIEEFVLCQEMYDKEIERETFEDRIEKYKETKEEKIEEEKQKNEQMTEKNIENIINKTTEYIKENLIQVIIVLIFIILTTITAIILIKSAKQSRRLE